MMIDATLAPDEEDVDGTGIYHCRRNMFRAGSNPERLDQ